LLLVSYNAMPGWAHLQPIRGILRQYAQLRQGDSAQRMRDALSYVVFLREKHAKYFEDNPRAAAYVDSLIKQDPRYLVHEYLNEHWTSFYFSEVAGAFGQAGLSFIGSLPVFTNFWDLCVRPEFQELFRTTTHRLVTEAHKDFCANTAFRWDVYAKSPTMLKGPQDRLRVADDLHYRLAKQGIKLPHQANLGVVTTTVQGPLYEALLKLLEHRSLRLSEILAADALRGTAPADVFRAVDAGVAMGMLDISTAEVVSAPPDLSGSIKVAHPYNRAILEANALSGHAVSLASELTGNGHTIGDLDATLLQEVADRGRDGLAARVEKRLDESGRSLQHEGQTVTDTALRHKLVEQTCENFLTGVIPNLAQLGIVTGA
jgi:hypothetical protein